VKRRRPRAAPGRGGGGGLGSSCRRRSWLLLQVIRRWAWLLLLVSKVVRGGWGRGRAEGAGRGGGQREVGKGAHLDGVNADPGGRRRPERAAERQQRSESEIASSGARLV
jgi:hypothetical protein